MTQPAPQASAALSEPRRLLWAVNHRTLLPAEVPILRSLGWEVFIPKIVPDHDPGFRSSAISYDYDPFLRLPEATLRVLNHHDFHERTWSATVEEILNKYFSVFITHFTYYTMPLSEAARKFRGLIVARAFGREHPRTYAEFAEDGPRKNLLAELAPVGDRLVFAQGYDNLAEIEPPVLRQSARTITVPLPDAFYRHADTWRGGGANAVFLCPAIRSVGYYRSIYERIKRDFGDLPHIIFGRQVETIDDSAVLPYLTDEDLLSVYATAPVFIYPHTEPRHVHYSPLEAMIVGTPTLYLRDTLLGMLTGYADLPGACQDIAEMHAKASRLLQGDLALAEAIRATQGRVLDTFAPDLARRQWASVLPDTAALDAAAS